MSTLQKLKELGFDDNKLKLDSCTYSQSGDECTINFVYPDSAPLTDEERESIKSTITTDINGLCAVTVKFNKSCFDADVIRKRIEEYFDTEYKALSLVFAPEDIEIFESNEGASIVFHCDTMTKQVLENKGFISSLEKFMKHKFFINFDISVQEKETNISLDDLISKPEDATTSLNYCLEKEKEINKFEVEAGASIYGKYTGEHPILITDLPHENGQTVVLAGTVLSPMITTFTRKSRVDGGEPEERKRFTFTLRDPSGKVDVVIFPKDEDVEKLEKITEGTELIVSGTVSIFNDRLNIKAQGLANCEVKTKELQRVYRKVNSKYYFVTPKPVSEIQQMDLFSLTEKKTDYWDTHDTVVVFDFETTGLDARSCKIIEIGAVKIKKGSIIETFQTLINPGEPIPEEITEITHIDTSMVVDAPSIDQVLPDFYKFTYGSVLSAYNIDFDYQFLSNNGNRLRLLFDNEQIDTLRLARDKVPSLSNYKLGTVVRALNITLVNAHRALADAYATAKVFIKLI